MQLSRIDESIKSESFVFLGPPRREIQGYNGLYSLTDLIKQENLKLENSPDGLEIIHTLFNSNISQLTEIYDKVSAAVVIINNSLRIYNLNLSQKIDLSNLLILNLGGNFRDNVRHISRFIDWYSEKSTDLYSVFISEQQISILRQLVNLVRDFYNSIKE